MGINSVLFLFIIFFIPLMILYVITVNAFFFVISLVLLIFTLAWYYYNLIYCKIKRIPASSRLFRGILEIHIGNKAKKKPEKFMVLFIDSVLWASENNIKKAIFYTWYGNENSLERYFKDRLVITKPNIYEDICNIYINPAYWFHNTGKKHIKVVINVNELNESDISILNHQRDRLQKRINKDTKGGQQ